LLIWIILEFIQDILNTLVVYSYFFICINTFVY
jgi:hypothetical protein